MASINFLGRLTKEPESVQSQNGAIIHIDLADNFGKDQVAYYRCSVFGKQGEMIMNSCKKGHRLNVCGRLKPRSYKDNQGIDRMSLDVDVTDFDFIEAKEQATQAPAAQPQQTQAPAAQQPQYYKDPQTGIWYQAVGGKWVPYQQQPAQPVAPPASAAQTMPPPAPAVQTFPPNAAPTAQPQTYQDPVSGKLYAIVNGKWEEIPF